MKETFQTNRGTLIFYSILSLGLVPLGLMNFYTIVQGSGSYWIGAKAFLAPVLPLLVFFSYRNGQMVIQSDGITIGQKAYAAGQNRYEITTEHRAFSERPLTTLWRSNYDVMSITQGSEEVARIDLEMSGHNIDRLKKAIDKISLR